MYTRVATHALNASLLDASLRLQSRWADKATQSSSGLLSGTYAGLDTASTGRVLNLQEAYGNSVSLSNSLSLTHDRIEAMHGALGDMIGQVNALRTTLSAASTHAHGGSSVTGSETKVDGSATKGDPTTKATIAANLPKGAKVGDKFTTGVSVYDDQGKSHQVNVTWEKTGDNTWQASFKGGEGETVDGGPVKIEFNADGTFKSPTTNPKITPKWGGATTDTPLELDLSKLTQKAWDDDTITETAKGMLEDLKALLNTQHGGRYLFSGTKTTDAPVEGLPVLTRPLSLPTTEDFSYYGGGDDRVSASLGDDHRMDYGCTAKDPSIEKAIRAATIAATMDTQPVDPKALKEAYDLASKALDGLSALQAGLSVSAKRVETAQDSAEELQVRLDTSLSDLTKVNVAEVTAQMKAYEAQLQASYAALATVMNHSLVDYLR